MPFIEDNLIPGESVVYRAHVHWGLLIPAAPWLIGMLVCIAGVESLKGPEVKFIFGCVAVVCIIAAIVVFIDASIRLVTTEFAVTDKRVIGKVGLIRRESVEILLGKVEGIRVSQGILGRLLGFGTIAISGTGTSQVEFKGIEAPLECRRAIQRRVGEG